MIMCCRSGPELMEVRHPKGCEISCVARDDSEVVDLRGRCDQRVLIKMVWLAMHELRPEPEDRHVGRQDVPYRRQFISPGFDLRRPKWILRPRNLDAGLNLSKVTAER